MKQRCACLPLFAILPWGLSWLGSFGGFGGERGRVARRASLLVPARLVEETYGQLAGAGCIPRRWHPEGRYGIPIQVAEDAGKRLIPLLANAVDRLPPDVRANLGAGTVQLREKEIPWKKMPARPICPDVGDIVRSRPAGNFTFAELFAGIGGFRLGLERLGGSCVFASEIEPHTRDLYTRNFGHVPVVAGDIQEVHASDIPAHDILVAGFPCQPFSALGSQPAFDDERGLLFREIVRVLGAAKPRFFLLENVPGLLRCGRALATIMEELSSAGYEVRVETVNARQLTAQARKRVFFIGFRSHASQASPPRSFELPRIPDLCLRAEDVLETEEEVKRSGLLEDYTLTDEQFLRLQESEKWARRGGMASTLAWNDKVCATLVGHYGKTLRKGNSQLVPRPAPSKPRRFTPRECARLMGVPNSFKLTGRREDQTPGMWYRALYKMFGNSVSPPVVAALCGSILATSDTSHLPKEAGLSAALELALEALAPRKLLVWRALPTSRNPHVEASRGPLEAGGSCGRGGQIGLGSGQFLAKASTQLRGSIPGWGD
ncbi:dsaVM [Symbiodinium natans]|uniref:Cytosine-specific methyltransferase n=1 Tax=Symbiodinium natans TaxID=878477 RepID=A0A812L8Z9_9DINO|nr:dsaVM [Symbiodinium natans]